jgi:ATPases with chaperone activity, ATP-binding subunit
MRPEFLNRVDDIIMFRPLMVNEIRDIIKIQLDHLKERVAEQNIDLRFTDYVIDYLTRRGFDPQFGARPLKRVIQKDIVNLLSKKIISGEVDKSKPLLIDVFDGVVVLRNEVEQ